MNTITYEDLKNCAALAIEAQNAQERILKLRSLAEFGGLTCGITGGRGTPLKDGTGEGGSAIADITNNAQGRISEYLSKSGQVEQTINALQNTKHREVLKLKYIDGYTWPEVAERMHYDERQCRRIHAVALERLFGVHRQTA